MNEPSAEPMNMNKMAAESDNSSPCIRLRKNFDDLDQKIKHYRVDKMMHIAVEDEKRDGREAFNNIDLSGIQEIPTPSAITDTREYRSVA